MRLSAAFASILLLCGCGDFPKDSRDTLKRAQAGETLKAGYAVAEPWVKEGPSGIEVDLLNAWARSAGVKLEWIRGGEAQLVEALGQHSLDLVVAGFIHKTPHGKKMGVTQPYLSTNLVIGAAPGAPVRKDWKGVPVAYDPRRPHFAAAIEKAKAVPVPAKPGRGAHYAAVYEPELAALGLSATGKKLLSEKRVIAASPGENALVLSLDQFLHAHEQAIATRLAAEARR